MTPDDPDLSPWWLRAVAIVMVLGFAGLLTITSLAYRNAPPIPQQVLDAQGTVLFSGEDIGEGQVVFLKYGLMANGGILVRGAYLGPDYTASALHQIGIDTTAAIALERHGQPLTSLTARQQAAVLAETAVELKTNRYDPVAQRLQLTAPESIAYRKQLAVWTADFHDPAKNGGLRRDVVSDPTELRQFTAFVTWAAWVSVARRPGTDYPYTNNFPYDPSVGNVPIPSALLWSASA